jgi:hypothetical protein
MANRKNASMKNKNKNKDKKNKNKKNKSNKKNRIMYGGMGVMPGSMPMPMKGGMAPIMAKPMMKGGMAPVNDTSMTMGQKDNLSQGNQFLDIHKNQHGGMSPYPGGVTGSVLTDSSMVASARTGPLDTALSQIQGMQDGGARRNKNKSKKNKSKKKRDYKRGHSRRNRMRGGSHSFGHQLMGSSLSENSMLLPSGLEKSAGLNYDWDAARNPNYWAPKP